MAFLELFDLCPSSFFAILSRRMSQLYSLIFSGFPDIIFKSISCFQVCAVLCVLVPWLPGSGGPAPSLLLQVTSVLLSVSFLQGMVVLRVSSGLSPSMGFMARTLLGLPLWSLTFPTEGSPVRCLGAHA